MFYLNMVTYPMFFLFMCTRNDLGYLPDAQGYSGLVSEPCTPTQTPDAIKY